MNERGGMGTRAASEGNHNGNRKGEGTGRGTTGYNNNNSSRGRTDGGRTTHGWVYIYIIYVGAR